MSETNATPIPTKVTLGTSEFPVRFSFANFFVPKADEDKIDKVTGKPLEFYSCQIIIDKRDKAGVAAINKAVDTAAAPELKGNKKIPSSWKLPLRDGDEEYDEKGEHLKGHYFFNCKAKSKPAVVGTRKYTEEDVAAWEDENAHEPPAWKAKNRPMVGKLIPIGEDDIKSGDYGRVSVNFYFYDVDSKGIGAGLNNVQFLREGEALGGTRSSADDDFGDIEDGFED